MEKKKTVIDVVEQERRREALAYATASVRQEGLEPSREALEIGERYVSGEIDLEEHGRLIGALYGLKR